MKKDSFGNIIAGLRKQKGMTQLELAEKMELHLQWELRLLFFQLWNRLKWTLQ